MRFKVHPNSMLVGNRFIDVKLRTQFGVSVVVIQRGLETIIAPKSEEMIYPQDELLVLGNDAQLDLIRPQIEGPCSLIIKKPAIFDYDLSHILVSENSPLEGLSIRDSKIRENYGAMVVGIERNNKRMINPKSTEEILAGDTLWTVGEKFQLARLKEAFSP